MYYYCAIKLTTFKLCASLNLNLKLNSEAVLTCFGYAEHVCRQQ